MPIAKFEMPDGKIARFEVPDGTTPEQAQVMVSEFIQTSPLEVPQEDYGYAGGAGEAFIQSLASAVPFGQKATTAMGAGIAKASEAVGYSPEYEMTETLKRHLQQNPELQAKTYGKYGQTEQDFGDLYEQGLQHQEALSEQNPWASGAGMVTGIGATLPLASATALSGIASKEGIRGAINAIPKGLSKVGSFVRGGKVAKDAGKMSKLGTLGLRSAKGGAVLAPTAGLYSAGEAEHGKELEGFKYGAGAGLALGASLPVAGAVVAPVLAPLKNKIVKWIGGISPSKNVGTFDEFASGIKNVAGGDVAISKGIEKEALNKVKEKLKLDFPDTWKNILEEWKVSDKALVDIYSQQMTTLAKGSAQYPSGQSEAVKYFNKKILDAPENIKKAISKNVSSVENYYKTADDLLEAGRVKAYPLYKKAFSANKSMSSNEINNILTTPEGKKALKDAANIMQNDRSLMGLPDAELKQITRDLAAIGKMEDVKGAIASGLNLRTLDYVKKSMDTKIRKLYREGENHLASIVTAQKNSLIKEMDKLDVTRAYSRARAEAGDYLSVQSAMDKGRGFTKLDDPEIIKKTLLKMTNKEKEAFKIGVGKSIRDVIDKNIEGRNPYNKIMGSKTQKARLATILSPDEFKGLEKSLKIEDRMFKMKNEVLGGSPTTSKALAAADFAGDSASVAASVASGDLTGASVSGIRTVIRKLFDGMNDKTAGQVAKIIYEKNPEKKLLMLEGVSRSPVLTKSEKALVKQAYFRYDSLANSARGASIAPLGIIVSEDE